MTLLLIGYWKGSLYDDFPFPEQVEAALAPDVRAALTRYLDGGAPFEQYRGHSYCRYGCPGDNGSAELWDGTWVWPEGLSHYVRTHGVSLPSEFIAHATRSNQHTDSSVPRLRDPSEPVDSSLWVRWGMAHTSEMVATAINEARSTVAKRQAAARERAATELVAATGTSDNTCLTLRCARGALVGKAFCAQCLLSEAFVAGSFEVEAEEFARVRSLLFPNRGA